MGVLGHVHASTSARNERHHDVFSKSESPHGGVVELLGGGSDRGFRLEALLVLIHAFTAAVRERAVIPPLGCLAVA